MSPDYDREFYKAFEPLIPLVKARPKLQLEDIESNRAKREGGVAAFLEALPDYPDVEQTVYHVEAADGYRIPVHCFSKNESLSGPGPAIIHLHGGGMILGSAQLFAKTTARLASETSIPIFSVNYRLAPEFKGTTPVEDCYSVLLWLSRHSRQHGVDPARIAVYGESAGGGLAAGVTLIARDRNLQPRIAKQFLVYPMLDDRNTTVDQVMEPFAFWTTADNIIAWTALLGEVAGQNQASISPYSAPARATTLSGLPPAYIDVGGLDIFCKENIIYATRLLAENVTTEFHLYPGVPHVFELIAPSSRMTKKAYENRVNAMLSF
ncbi:hypothetical protein PMIN04_012138 [Paraphaeosphaeria minitans]|uniref:Alpha/beta hydrolase fold-3 domain-containing protein n=1 Tax=Paraphaeosphaeria minitans TaxID=565426 RepID=A0A9P6G7B2_9PLEO|nr:hypothetical protein PMIN01_12130 [Paraphaeosphaeria minitans]